MEVSIQTLGKTPAAQPPAENASLQSNQAHTPPLAAMARESCRISESAHALLRSLQKMAGTDRPVASGSFSRRPSYALRTPGLEAAYATARGDTLISQTAGNKHFSSSQRRSELHCFCFGLSQPVLATGQEVTCDGILVQPTRLVRFSENSCSAGTWRS